MMMHLVRLIRWLTWHRHRHVERSYWLPTGEIPWKDETLNLNDLGLYLLTPESDDA